MKGSGFRIQGFGSSVEGLGSRVEGCTERLASRAEAEGEREGARVPLRRAQRVSVHAALGVGVYGAGCRAKGLGSHRRAQRVSVRAAVCLEV